ncbi:MAG: hypothetical protein D6729_18125 [Deltaproteobacteria bacterium]|nr:MAG: hypothetical protein D6729_18125 [Deltaproteobacteria bacterium]
MDPTRFAGFSKDETRFAYAAYSTGAGVSILTVVDTRSGERITDFPLDGESELQRARQLLRDGGFSDRRGEHSPALGKGARLTVHAERGSVQVEIAGPGGRKRLEPAPAFRRAVAHFDAPQVALWGLSPSGRFAALEVTQDAGPELGRAVTYVIVDLMAP